jgi:ABC-type polysaccharide/polyol phosphate transport system ATPase subunit
MQTFEQLRAEGKTIVFVSHDLQSVSRLSDRAMYIDDSRIVALGRPDEVIARYLSAHGLALSPLADRI